ncbi:MAG: hypothetical protein ABIV50_02610 [Opitutus sp.]
MSTRGFTLVELLIAAGLSAFILVGVLSSFLMMGRISANIQNYTEIENNARKALEIMSREIRAAFTVTSYSTTSFSISLPDSTGSTPSLAAGTAPLYNQLAGSGAYSVTYTYDATNKRITRTGPPVYDPTGTSTTTTFISNVQQITGLANNDVFNYYRYVNTGAALGQGYVNGYTGNTVTSPNPTTAIQQIEVKFLVNRQSTTVTKATNKVLSARFILRNKR